MTRMDGLRDTKVVIRRKIVIFRTRVRLADMICYTVGWIILVFWLVVAYDLLEDRRIDVVINVFVLHR